MNLQKETQRKPYRYIIYALIILLLAADIGFFIMGKFFPNILNKGNTQLPQQEEIIIKTQNAIKAQLKDFSINSGYAILLDLEDFTPLYEKNIDKKIYPASLTKVMSAVVALDHINDLSKTVTVEEKDLEGLLEANASVAGLQAGDTLTYEDLLYALVLPSGADAANVLANHLFGSMDNYVAEMNNKAKAYGMTSTHFVNSTGLHEDDHYTTIKDLEMMMKHAWINTAFQKILTTTQYEIPSLDLKMKSTLLSYGSSIVIQSKDNESKSTTKSLPFEGGEIIGGKSGYTLEAECCLISVAKMENGHYYMLITAKATGEPISDHHHINDAINMYECIAKAIEKGA